MQCSESAKPVKAVWHDDMAVKAKLDFVNVTKLFQDVKKKHFGMQQAVEVSCRSTWTIKPRLMCNLSFGESCIRHV